MNSIQSLGGPYIIVDQSSSVWWGGSEGKLFSLPISSFPSDYEAAGDLTCGVSHPPCNIAKLVGEKGSAMLISMPFEIAVISSNSSCVCFAQAEYADEGWTFTDVTADIFGDAAFDEVMSFDAAGGSYFLFDSIYTLDEAGGERLEFKLSSGNYCLSAAMHMPDKSTSLFLYKIERSVSQA